MGCGRLLRLVELYSTEDAVRLVSTDGGIGHSYPIIQSIYSSVLRQWQVTIYQMTKLLT